ncbi:MAG: NUDIX hydrolase, partial [Candidatus Pacebacteria bacterium]|nr:NUDIX hydrolase [Candidatus Paceibacterota bacterium]
MIREEIRKIIEKVNPFDELEKEHIKNALAWIGSGEEIFRIQKPDIPPKHLVSYFVLIDPIAKKLLLLD